MTLIAVCLLPALTTRAEPTKRLSGEQAFAACSGCHSLGAGQEHKVGPNLAGVVGRKAAQSPGYTYSPALQNSELVWSRENLFAWLAASEALVPDSWMLYANVLEPEELMALIDFLETGSK